MNIFWRIAHYLYDKRGWGKVARLFEFISYAVGANAISAKADIDKTVYFSHRGVGCVVAPSAKIGAKCRINPNVTIGSKLSQSGVYNDTPTIEANVKIGVGACVLGSIIVGENSIIGANAVVTKNVPPNSIAMGVPAKVSQINAD